VEDVALRNREVWDNARNAPPPFLDIFIFAECVIVVFVSNIRSRKYLDPVVTEPEAPMEH